MNIGAELRTAITFGWSERLPKRITINGHNAEIQVPNVDFFAFRMRDGIDSGIHYVQVGRVKPRYGVTSGWSPSITVSNLIFAYWSSLSSNGPGFGMAFTAGKT
ncbi:MULTISPECIES: hypothetical protein [Methylocaldum]